MVLDEEDKGVSNGFMTLLKITFDDYLHYLLNGGLDQIEADILKSFNLERWLAYNDDNMITEMLFKTEVD